MNERKEETLSNMKITGFSCNTRIVSADFVAYANNTDLDFTKTLLKLILKRDNQQFIIAQDDLKTLGLSSNLFTMARRSFYQDHPWQISMVGFTVSVHGETMLSFDIDLGGVLDLHGSDELLVELSCGTGFMSTDVLLASSYLELKPIKTLGFESYVPIIRSYSITAGERRKSWDLGNNVRSIHLLNYLYTSHITPAISSCTLSSKKFDETYTFYDLVASRLVNRLDQGDGSGATINAIDEFDQCFELIGGSELDGVNLDIQFNPANVTANDNILVVRSAYTDVKTLIEHDAKVISAQNEKIASLKQNGVNAVIS